MMPMMPKTLREALTKASSFLKQMDSHQDPQTVSELLLCHLLGIGRSELFQRLAEPFPPEYGPAWAAMLERKAAGEPVQYITGEQEFYGLPFYVNPQVLIPRPETEILVEEVLGWGRRQRPGERLVAADIGTGSGAIAVALAVHCPAWDVLACDISPGALAVAEKNARLNGVAARLRFLQGDMLAPLLKAKLPVDIIVSNPPYSPRGELAGLAPEVIGHEPVTALDGGDDGLMFYRKLAEQLGQLSRPPLLVAVETGMGQARQVADMLAARIPAASVRIVRDLAGIERHVLAAQDW